VEDSTSGAKRLKRARFMPEIEALDLRWCMWFFFWPLQSSRCCRQWDGCKWTSVVAVQKSNALSRLASRAKTGRELTANLDAPFCPAASFPSPAPKSFGRYRMRPVGRLTGRFVPFQSKQVGRLGHFSYSLTVKKLHGHQLCARPKFQPPKMAQQYVVIPSFAPPLRASKTS
jgi:hypothetical protein